MKTPTFVCLILITGLLAAEPPIPPNLNPVPMSVPVTHAAARMAVEAEIISRLRPSLPRFSRVSPPVVLPSYQQLVKVGSEERLPFTVSISWGRAAVSGYVRLSDNAIFLYRPETKDHIRSNLDPRFAPANGTRIEAEKQG